MMGTSRTQWNRQKGYLTFLESELRGKRFFEGDALGLVDIISNYIAFWDGVLQQMAEIDQFNEKKKNPCYGNGPKNFYALMLFRKAYQTQISLITPKLGERPWPRLLQSNK